MELAENGVSDIESDYEEEDARAAKRTKRMDTKSYYEEQEEIKKR